MNIVEFLLGSKPKVTDSFSTGFKRPSEDTTLGGSDDIKNVQYKQENGKYTLTYDRAFDTGDKYDKQVTLDTSMETSFAWGSGGLNYHGHNYKIEHIMISRPKNSRIKQAVLN